MHVINTKNIPDSLGPYSQYIDVGDFIFISGQIPIIPDTMMMPHGIYDQTYQTLQNIRHIVEFKKLNIDNVVKITLFIKNIKDLSEINISYKDFFCKYSNNNPIIFPVRSCVVVSDLPKDASIEIDAIAVVSKKQII